MSVLVADLANADGRWPGFIPAASELGIRAVFVLPLQIGAARVGVLAMYRDEAGELNEHQFQDASVLAEAATVLMLASPEGENEPAASWVLGDRSRFRPEVHQAVGMTMVHLGVSPQEAFARLCAHGFATGTPIAEVAAEIVAKALRLESDGAA